MICFCLDAGLAVSLALGVQIQLEEENVKWLQDRMKQSSDMTSGKENVYLGFDAETLISSACDKKFKMTVSA